MAAIHVMSIREPKLPSLYILLATFNGAKYLPQLLDSLLEQQICDWRLLVRDDGSSDETVQIIRSAMDGDTRIELLGGTPGRMGVTKSFEILMTEALHREADFFVLCDQDDVWLRDKLSTLSATLLRECAIDKPALAFSDLTVVDAQLNIMDRSFFSRSHAGEAWHTPGKWLLLHNLVPGCAMMGNRELLRRCLPMPSGTVIHDWWVLLCAASMGQVVAVPESLILYRQHGGNTIGAETYLKRILRFLRDWRVTCLAKQQIFLGSIAQDLALEQRLNLDDPKESAWRSEIGRMFTGLFSPSPWRRLSALLFGNVRRVGWARNLLLLCVLLTVSARQITGVTTTRRKVD